MSFRRRGTFNLIIRKGAEKKRNKVNKKIVQQKKLGVAEMKMRWMCGRLTRMDQVRNENTTVKYGNSREHFEVRGLDMRKEKHASNKI